MQTFYKRSSFEVKSFKEINEGSRAEFDHTVLQHHYKVLWTFVANGILGLWLITSPFAYDYHSHALAVSDIVSGALVILIESAAFSPRRAILRWGTSVIAMWLLFAPLVFWSPTPAVYYMDTIIACCLIAFSVLVPGMPGRGGLSTPGPDQPPGWSYNPSSWIRRWLGIGLSLLGFFIARYLAGYQLGYINHAWDPFFGSSSEKVLTSVVSKAFPISDAGFGSVAYILEALSGFMGDRARWRTAPWIVVLFALLVLPLGLTSITLVIMQPVAVGAWCGLCLIAAVGMLASVPLAVHEVIAMGQFLAAAKRQNKEFWSVFWMGGNVVGAGNKDPERLDYSFGQRWIASIQGVTVPWMIAVQLVIGIWLMARPDLLPFDKATALCDHLLGAVIVTVAAVATAEVTRTARLVNVFLGGLLVVCGLIFAMHSPAVLASECVSGIVLVLVSLPKGEIIEQYAGWAKYIR